MHGVVEVFDGENEGNVGAESQHSNAEDEVFSQGLVGDQVKEEDGKVDEEGVPHHNEGERCPPYVAVLVQAKGGEQISEHVCERQDGVEHSKQDRLFGSNCKKMMGHH